MKKLDMRDVLGSKGIAVSLLNILGDSGFKHWYRLSLLGDKDELKYQKHNHHEIPVLKIYYDQVKSMPVWPFSVSTILKILLTVSSPVAAVLIQTVVSYYL